MGHAAELLVLTALLAAGWVAAARLWSGVKRRARGAGEARLLRICRGDAHQAERLIQGEMTRRPGISRAEAAARAVARHRRDNG